jgi:hypothetical protein
MPTHITVSVLAEIGEFYWSPAYGRTRDAFRALEGSDWRAALVEFLRGYAFERQGRSPHYAEAAIAAVGLYKGSAPRNDFEAFVWQEFLRQIDVEADGKGAAVKVNPLAPHFRKQRSRSITALVSDLEGSQYNLVRWAAQGIREGELETVSQQIRAVRGLGTKLTAWFLRDLVMAFGMEEADLEPSALLQPIDIWTRRGASVLAGLPQTLRYGRHGDARAAAAIVEVARASGVRPTLVNTGLVMFGELFTPSPDAFEAAIASPVALCRFLSEQKEAYAARQKFVSELLCAFLS